MNIRNWNEAQLDALRAIWETLIIAHVNATVDEKIAQAMDQLKMHDLEMDDTLTITFDCKTTAETLYAIHEGFGKETP